MDQVWLTGQQAPVVPLPGFLSMGLDLCHHTWLFAWVLEAEFRDGGGLSSNTLPAELSPHVRETAFYLSNAETLILTLFPGAGV